MPTTLNRRWTLGLLIVGAAVAMIAAACTGDGDDGDGGVAGETPPPGDTPPADDGGPEVRTVSGEGRFDWQVRRIDRGVKPDLALDPDDRAHIAYGLEAMPGFVKHTIVGDSLVTSTVAEGYFYFPLEIAVNAEGVPWIAFHNHDFEDQSVALAQDLETGEWLLLRTESPGHDGWDNSIALDANGRPHTVSVDPVGFGSDVGLEYGFFDANEWTVEQVGTGPLVYQFGTSIAIDAAGNPQATFYDDGTQDLMYATRAGGAWAISTVDSDGDVGRFADMLLDADGRSHVAYLQVDGETSGTIKYAVFDGGVWRSEEVDALDGFFIGPVGNMTGARNVISLDLDSQGNPVIAYSDQREIKLARRRANAWQIETVLTAGDDPLGQTVSMALDAGDTPHLTYFVATDLTRLDGTVFYAKGVPNGS